MARNLFTDSPTETVMPMSRSTSRANRASTFAGIMPCTRSVPERSRKASSIESGSTSGVSACMAWRTSRPTRTYFAMSGPITIACGQSVQRLEHRHRRAHAIGARDVAGRRHHAALAAADDDGLVGDIGVVALLDGGVERVAIDMGERQRGQGVVAHQPGRAAAAAAPRPGIEIAKAVPAKAGRRAHDAGAGVLTARRAPICGSPSTWRAAAMLVGCSSLSLGERLHGCVIAQHEIEHAGQKCGDRRPLSAGSPGRFRFRPGTGPAARDRRR